MDAQVLLKALVDKELLKQDQADKLIQESAAGQKSAEDLIYENRLADETEVAKTKSQILKMPYKKVSADTLDKEFLKVIPIETAQTYKIIPISRTENMLVVGMVNPDDQKAQDALRFVAKQLHSNLGVYLISHSD